MNANMKKYASIAERFVKAFMVAFVAVYVAGGLSIAHLADASVLQKAANAGLAALGSLILSVLGTTVGNRSTPSLLPARLDPTVVPADPLPSGGDWPDIPPMQVDLHAELSAAGPPDGWPSPEPPAEAMSGPKAPGRGLGGPLT